METLGGRLARVSLPLRTDRLVLRLPTLEDAEAVAHAGNDPEVARGTFVPPPPFTPQKAYAILERRLQGAHEGTGLVLLIEEASSGEVAGTIGLSLATPPHDAAVLFYWLSPRKWGQGYATEAAEAMLHLGFETLDLHRISATVLSYNQRSMRVLRKLHFRREGRAREVRKEGDHWLDEYHYGLLQPEYRRRIAAMAPPVRRR